MIPRSRRRLVVPRIDRSARAEGLRLRWSGRNNHRHCDSHFQPSGRRSTNLRNRCATRARAVTIRCRIMAVVAQAIDLAAMVPAVRVRLKAMTASTNHGSVRAELPGRHIRQGTVFQVGVDLPNDRVLPVGTRVVAWSARQVRNREVTASNWRTCPKVKARRKAPRVEGA